MFLRRFLSGELCFSRYLTVIHLKECNKLANIASAKKRISVNAKKRLQNQMLTSQVKTALKKFESAVKDNNAELVKTLYPATVGLVDNITIKGIWHKNKAARKKSYLALKLNSVLSAQA